MCHRRAVIGAHPITDDQLDTASSSLRQPLELRNTIDALQPKTSPRGKAFHDRLLLDTFPIPLLHLGQELAHRDNDCPNLFTLNITLGKHLHLDQIAALTAEPASQLIAAARCALPVFEYALLIFDGHKRWIGDEDVCCEGGAGGYFAVVAMAVAVLGVLDHFVV